MDTPPVDLQMMLSFECLGADCALKRPLVGVSDHMVQEGTPSAEWFAAYRALIRLLFGMHSRVMFQSVFVFECLPDSQNRRDCWNIIVLKIGGYKFRRLILLDFVSLFQRIMWRKGIGVCLDGNGCPLR